MPLRSSDILLKKLLQTARLCSRTLVMGILNITPDSFSDGGRFYNLENALAQARRMVDEGADILDIGGESTRPATFHTSIRLDPEEELLRIIPIIQLVTECLPEVPLSVDTYKSNVAHKAIDAGAAMINDISAMRADIAMSAVAAELGVPICLMHIPGLPTAIPVRHQYSDVVSDVKSYLEERIETAIAAGINRDNLVIDPGFGFGKTVEQNLILLRRLREICVPGIPLLSGTSRKSLIGKTLSDLPPEDRLEGTSATVAISIMNGASIVRVHDVREMSRVARMTDAILHAQ